MMKIESLGTSSAKIIYGENHTDLLTLSVQEVLNLFEPSGVLLFRRFGVTPTQMRAFSEKFSSRFVLEPARRIVDSSGNGFVQLVDEGMDYVPPHCEHASSPFRPDVVWFCCGVPAAQNGETLFWDGVRAWEELSEEVRQLFLSKKIKFKHHFPAIAWKIFFGSDTTIADVERALNDLDGVNYLIKDDHSIYMEYTCSAVVKTKFSNQYAFANSILYNHRNKTVFFEDGLPFPDEVIEEIQTVMNRLMEVIRWQSGDLVMIDNSRFLHGRTAFDDTKRQVFSALSYLNGSP
ncbi:TauD/TfdA family dioxygenase [Microcoleus sp. FACHB-SPT15]|nr:TauD/TfdA family dioxygenase [Microcoleus sp. FACHB-SPT15]